MVKDNTIWIFVVLAVFFLFGSIGFSYYALNQGPKIVGFAATSTGTVNVTIQTSMDINFTTSKINFSSGKVDATKTFAVLESGAGTSFQGNWSFPAQNLTLENVGNVNVSLNLTSGLNATTFIGGSNPRYLWKVMNGTEPGSCINTTTFNVYLNATIGTGTQFCSQFGFLDNADVINIAINLTIPYDSLTGARGDVITATAYTAP